MNEQLTKIFSPDAVSFSKREGENQVSRACTF